MKTVILDGKTTNPGDLSWDFLKKYGEVEIFDRTPREKIVERTHDADIVVTNKTPLTRAEIDKNAKREIRRDSCRRATTWWTARI